MITKKELASHIAQCEKCRTALSVAQFCDTGFQIATHLLNEKKIGSMADIRRLQHAGK